MGASSIVASDIFASSIVFLWALGICTGRCGNGREPSIVVWPFCKGCGPWVAALLAFFALYSLYVVVRGITSSKNWRLSIRATAFAGKAD